MDAILAHPIPTVTVLILLTFSALAAERWAQRRADLAPIAEFERAVRLNYRLWVVFVALMTTTWIVSLWIIHAMIQIDGIFAATSPVCVMANRPRLTRSEMRAERLAARIRREARRARQVRDTNTNLDPKLPEPIITDTGDGSYVITLPDHGVIVPAFADYASADLFRIRYMERTKILDRFPRRIR